MPPQAQVQKLLQIKVVYVRLASGQTNRQTDRHTDKHADRNT